MNVHQSVDAVERETLIVRIRRQPVGVQAAIAAAGLALLLLVAWLLFGRAAPPPPAPGPQPVGVIVVREEPVALSEVAAAAAIEEEHLRVPERRGNRDLEQVLDVLGCEPGVVDPGSVQLTPGQEVGELDCAEVSLLLV